MYKLPRFALGVAALAISASTAGATTVQPVLAYDKTAQVLSMLDSGGSPSPVCLVDPVSHKCQSPVDMAGVAPLDLTYAATPNPNAIKLGVGNSVSFYPALSGVATPSDSSTYTPSFYDHQRASALISSITRDDTHSEEQTLAVLTTVQTGYAKTYSASTAYALGDNITIGNAAYRCVQAGTTGASSPPPGTRPTAAQGGSYTVTDGTVKWQWVNDAAIGAKVGVYNEQSVMPGGGASWAQANNVSLEPGTTPSFNINSELDFGNNSGTDCVYGTNCLGVWVSMGGTNMSTSALYLSGSATAGKPGTVFWGERIAGTNFASQADLEIDASGVNGISFCGNGLCPSGALHSHASIWDPSTAPISLLIEGTHTSAGISISDVSPAAIVTHGNHNLAEIYLNSASAQNGIDLAGTYVGSQIIGTGFLIEPNGQFDAKGSGSAGFASLWQHTGADFIANDNTPIAFQSLGTHAGGQFVGTGFSVDSVGNVFGQTGQFASLKFSNFTNTACTNVGWMPVQDLGGNTRKVMICN